MMYNNKKYGTVSECDAFKAMAIALVEEKHREESERISKEYRDTLDAAVEQLKEQFPLLKVASDGVMLELCGEQFGVGYSTIDGIIKYHLRSWSGRVIEDIYSYGDYLIKQKELKESVKKERSWLDRLLGSP